MYCTTYVELSRILLSKFYSFQTIRTYATNYTNLLCRQYKKNSINPLKCQGIVVQARYKSIKMCLDYSKVPKLDENDIVEQFVRGDGPGGQATAKTNNAVVLKHKPTGIVIKCHETRSLWDNKKRARELLIIKLDNLINGNDSIQNQERLLLAKRSAKQSRKKEKIAALKAAFKKREGID